MTETIDDLRIGEIGWASGDARRGAELPEGLGPSVRALRQRRGLNQKQLAAMAGLTPSSITRLEHGERGASQESINRLAAALAATTEEHNHLLAAAGFLTEQAATLLDEPDLVRLSAALADPRLTTDDRRMLLTYVRLAVSHAEARGYGVASTRAQPEPPRPRRVARGRRALQRDRVRSARSA